MEENRLRLEEARRPLIPQFSVRWLLGVTAAVAVFFSIVALGARGQAWAAAVAMAVLSLVVAMLVYAVGFGVVWLFSVVTLAFEGRKGGSGESPFAQLPSEGDSPTNDKDVAATPIVLD